MKTQLSKKIKILSSFCELFSLFSKTAFFQKLQTQKSSRKFKMKSWEKRIVFFYARINCSSIISSNIQCLPILIDDKVEIFWKSFGAKNAQNQVFFFGFFHIFCKKRLKISAPEPIFIYSNLFWVKPKTWFWAFFERFARQWIKKQKQLRKVRKNSADLCNYIYSLWHTNQLAFEPLRFWRKSTQVLDFKLQLTFSVEQKISEKMNFLKT